MCADFRSQFLLKQKWIFKNREIINWAYDFPNLITWQNIDRVFHVVRKVDVNVFELHRGIFQLAHVLRCTLKFEKLQLFTTFPRTLISLPFSSKVVLVTPQSIKSVKRDRLISQWCSLFLIKSSMRTKAAGLSSLVGFCPGCGGSKRISLSKSTRSLRYK
jgi:hypothetical protein